MRKFLCCPQINYKYFWLPQGTAKQKKTNLEFTTIYSWVQTTEQVHHRAVTLVLKMNVWLDPGSVGDGESDGTKKNMFCVLVL